MEKIAPMEVTCQHCGQQFVRTHGKFPRFCSQVCGSRANALPIEQRIEAMSLEMPNGCREWIGSLNHAGYGQVSHQGAPKPAHRVAYELTRGPIPKGLFVCHKCDNPKCIKVDHLFLGTNADNMRDARSKRRMRHGDQHRDTVFTSGQVADMRRRAAEGESIASIARSFVGAKYITVYHIVTGTNRKYG